jgi:hypothetical protein
MPAMMVMAAITRTVLSTVPSSTISTPGRQTNHVVARRGNYGAIVFQFHDAAPADESAAEQTDDPALILMLRVNEEHRMQTRRVKREKTFEERLAEEAQRFREAASQAQPGMARELLLRRVRQMEAALGPARHEGVARLSSAPAGAAFEAAACPPKPQ